MASGQDNPDQSARPKILVFLLLDGWGIAPPSEANALSKAKMPFFSRLIREYPAAVLRAQFPDINSRYLALGSGVKQESGQPFSGPTLTGLLSQAGLKQLKLASAERLAALTCFFSGCLEERLPGEDWLSVSSLDRQRQPDPGLTQIRLARELVRAIDGGEYDFIVASSAALDLAAASGDEALIGKTAARIDRNLEKIAAAVAEKQGVLIISSSHGNAEKTKDLVSEEPDKSRTNNPVPFIICGEEYKGLSFSGGDAIGGDLSLAAPSGDLEDSAATLADILALPGREDLPGHSLAGLLA